MNTKSKPTKTTKTAKRATPKRTVRAKPSDLGRKDPFERAAATKHPNFRVSVLGERTGLYYCESGKELFVCGLIVPIGESTNIDGRGAGTRIVFRNARGVVTVATIPAAMMMAPDKLYAYLTDIGLPTSSDNAKLRAITIRQYLHDFMPVGEFVTVQGDGWREIPHGEPSVSLKVYGLGPQIFQPTDAPIIACRANVTHEQTASPLRARALLQLLRKITADHLAVFALCAAAASVLLRTLSADALMIFFVGETSLGKTTLLRLVASLFGPPEMYTWQSTKDGAEAAARQSQDRPLVMDEVGQGDGATFADAAYRFTNDSSKLRSTSSGSLAGTFRNVNVTVSAGEESPLALIRKAGREIKGGQYARLLPIPVDQAHGVWTKLGDYTDGAFKSAAVEQLSRESAGAFAESFCRYVVENLPAVIQEEPSKIASLVQEIGDEFDLGADRVVHRVIQDFSRIAYAGLVARKARAVPWTEKRIVDAVRHAFGLWLLEYQRERPATQVDVMRRLRMFFQSRRGNQFPPLAAHGSAHPGTLGGYEHTFSGEAVACFLVLPAFFEQHICKGLEMKLVLAALTERELLRLGPRKAPTTPVHMPLTDYNRAFYVIRRTILAV